ncbi:MAG: alanine racemase [Oscillospiraceae bacterium]
MLEEKTRTWAEVKLSAIQYNYYSIKQNLPENCKFLGVVKANAYGHGAVGVAKMLERVSCDYLAVACLDEALELRNAGISTPILILGYTNPMFAEKLIANNITQILGSFEAAKAYSKAIGEKGKLKIHIKLETGMGRTGFDVRHGNIDEVLAALKFPCFEAEGICTHFAVSDEPEREEYTQKQFKIFVNSVTKIEESWGRNFEIKHCANSAAVLNYPEMSLDMVRPGLILYGLYPTKEKGKIPVAPAMELKSRIVAITELQAGESVSYGCTFTATEKTRLAVLPIGYADGLHRVLSNKMEVIINDTRAKQVGRICMDMCMVDITSIPTAKVGDIATIFGHDDDEVISVNELAENAGTISYEMVCSISSRVPRSFIL